MGNISAAYNTLSKRVRKDQTRWVTALSGTTLYKGSLAEWEYTGGAISGYITFGQNTANAIAGGVVCSTVTGDGTKKVELFITGDHRYNCTTGTAVGDEVYAGTAPNYVQSGTATGPKVGRVVNKPTTSTAIISIDDYTI